MSADVMAVSWRLAASPKQKGPFSSVPRNTPVAGMILSYQRTDMFSDQGELPPEGPALILDIEGNSAVLATMNDTQLGRPAYSFRSMTNTEGNSLVIFGARRCQDDTEADAFANGKWDRPGDVRLLFDPEKDTESLLRLLNARVLYLVVGGVDPAHGSYVNQNVLPLIFPWDVQQAAHVIAEALDDMVENVTSKF